MARFEKSRALNPPIDERMYRSSDVNESSGCRNNQLRRRSATTSGDSRLSVSAGDSVTSLTIGSRNRRESPLVSRTNVSVPALPASRFFLRLPQAGPTSFMTSSNGRGAAASEATRTPVSPAAQSKRFIIR